MALDVFSSVRGLMKPEEYVIDNFVFQVVDINIFSGPFSFFSPSKKKRQITKR